MKPFKQLQPRKKPQCPCTNNRRAQLCARCRYEVAFRARYYNANKTELLAKSTEWQQTHRKYVNAYHRHWYEANHEHIRKYQNRYYGSKSHH